MAEAATAEVTEEKGGKGKLMIIGGVVLVVVLAAVYFLVLAPKGDEGAVEAEPTPMFSMDEGAMVPVEETTVSLGGAERHFAQLSYSAVLAMDADPALVEGKFDRLRSEAQLVFRGYDAEFLNTPEGFLQLQEDLTTVAQELWPDGEVLEILVTSLLVQ